MKDQFVKPYFDAIISKPNDTDRLTVKKPVEKTIKTNTNENTDDEKENLGEKNSLL